MIKKLSKIRKEHKSLLVGDLELIKYDSNVISFVRRYENEEIQVVINLSNYVYIVDGNGMQELLTNTTKKSYELEKYSLVILKRRNI